MKKLLVIFVLGILLVGIMFFAPGINSVDSSWCCEKTIDGAWCQNAPKEQCKGNPYQSIPTFCESTSFCKLGWCYDSKEGTCLPHVPLVVCNENGGVWKVGEKEPPQCTLGCCVLGDQASFVTPTRCKALSADYGLETNFRSDIGTEVECLASVTSAEEGACVFEEDYQRTCRRLTQKECKDLEESASGTNVEFYLGVLCSAEDLGTVCGPTKQTTCIEGKDEVFYIDSCGNIANIYDSSKQNNQDYWTRIFSWEESCGIESNSAGSPTCGNCDYYSGSTCKAYERGVDKVHPVFGDYICRDLSCKLDGETYQHGETWCASNSQKENVPGQEDFRMICYNNEITIENCAPFRNKICLESETNGFSSARCTANVWQDCIAQENKDNCEDASRDCLWSVTKDDESKSNGGVCVPKYAPGFDFWAEETEATEICGIASAECVAKFEKGLLEGTWNCIENCNCCTNGKFGDKEYEGCTGSKWGSQLQGICTALGDCGPKLNYIGKKSEGYSDSLTMVDGEELE